MIWRFWTWRFWRRPPPPAPARIEPTVRPALKIAQDVLIASRRQPPTPHAAGTPWVIPEPPPGVLPAAAATLAQDRDIDALYGWAGTYGGGAISEGLAFAGYPYLAELTQRSEYRRPVEQIAKEMTRKWIKLTAAGDDDKTDKLKALDAELKRLKVRDAFRRAAECDGFFGKGQFYLDTGSTDDPDELKTPLFVDKAKIKVGGLKQLVVVEPLWSYPAAYNSTDPLRGDFYKPGAWYVMGKQVHVSRLMTFVGREVPDILKPAYQFGGLSLSQMAKPYVDNWLRTRQSVSDLIHNFSVSVLSTNMGATLAATPGQGLLDRAELFNNCRDNSGVMLVDKETEEFSNVSAPLGTLDHLQAQSQEHMAAVLGIPLIVLLGITPTGLNVSSDGEIAVWQAWVEAQQEHLFGSNLTRLLQIVQLSLFGAVDSDIGYAWEPLGKMDATALAAVRKSDADVAVEYIDRGVLAPIEERRRLAEAEDSLYSGLDVEDVPDPPDVTEPDDLSGDVNPLAQAA